MIQRVKKCLQLYIYVLALLSYFTSPFLLKCELKNYQKKKKKKDQL